MTQPGSDVGQSEAAGSSRWRAAIICDVAQLIFGACCFLAGAVVVPSLLQENCGISKEVDFIALFVFHINFKVNKATPPTGSKVKSPPPRFTLLFQTC